MRCRCGRGFTVRRNARGPWLVLTSSLGPTRYVCGRCQELEDGDLRAHLERGHQVGILLGDSVESLRLCRIDADVRVQLRALTSLPDLLSRPE